MKILNIVILSFAALFAVASVYGFEFGLPILLICLGLKECVNAKINFGRGEGKLAFFAFATGVFACVCAVFSIINMV